MTDEKGNFQPVCAFHGEFFEGIRDDVKECRDDIKAIRSEQSKEIGSLYSKFNLLNDRFNRFWGGVLLASFIITVSSTLLCGYLVKALSFDNNSLKQQTIELHFNSEAEAKDALSLLHQLQSGVKK